MSKLDELIAELCPDGVPYDKLSNVAEINRGVRVVREQLETDGLYPVYQNSLVPLGYYNKSNCFAGTPFVISAGAAGDIGFSDTDYWAADDCLHFDCSVKLDSRYLYHALLWKQPFIYSKVRRASIPRLSRQVIDNLEIPVPPLEVQREIVRILDDYTYRLDELISELTCELTARRKQYEYYRDQLLSFHGGGTSEVVWRTLGEMCVLKAGKSIPSSEISDINNEDFPIKCYGGNGIRGYVREANYSGEYPIIGRQGALCGNVNYATGDFYATEHAVVVTSKGGFTQRFLYHLLTQMNLNQYKSAGAQPGLAVQNLEKLSVPVLPHDVQNRIVNVLDNFESICSDLDIGLPAEIEARQKQYEYYRDSVLSFAGSSQFGKVERERERERERELSGAAG